MLLLLPLILIESAYNYNGFFSLTILTKGFEYFLKLYSYPDFNYAWLNKKQGNKTRRRKQWILMQ